jgi:pimeloyl-ACP methyl ester carboxylesterase
MGIISAPLVGHSMGGTVSLSVAMRFPERVQKVVVIGSPVHGSSLAFMLKLAGYRPNAWMLFNLFPVFRLIMRVASRFICRDPRFPNMMDRDLTKLSLESFLISISTLRQTDLRPNLDKVHVPVMGMYGDKDIIVHPRQWQPLSAGVPQAQIERFPNAGHFIMLDEPQLFREKLKNFLETHPPE